jgi:hypothetical protein
MDENARSRKDLDFFDLNLQVIFLSVFDGKPKAADILAFRLAMPFY